MIKKIKPISISFHVDINDESDDAVLAKLERLEEISVDTSKISSVESEEFTLLKTRPKSKRKRLVSKIKRVIKRSKKHKTLYRHDLVSGRSFYLDFNLLDSASK